MTSLVASRSEERALEVAALLSDAVGQHVRVAPSALALPVAVATYGGPARGAWLCDMPFLLAVACARQPFLPCDVDDARALAARLPEPVVGTLSHVFAFGRSLFRESVMAQARLADVHVGLGVHDVLRALAPRVVDRIDLRVEVGRHPPGTISLWWLRGA